MGITANYALAHQFLPNLIRIKTPNTVIGVMERKEKYFFDQLWNQAHVSHSAQLSTFTRAGYRIGVVDMPSPKEMGEAHLAAMVVDNAGIARLFLLEHDYVLATKADRTFITEREGARHTKLGVGPALTGAFDVDAKAFVDAVMPIVTGRNG
jgi:hypothetical protein